MKHFTFSLIMLGLALYANSQTAKTCVADCCAKTKKTAFSCKLTSPELRKRKETTIASLKEQVIEKKELKNGFAYKFDGTQTVMEQLNSFVKDEKECCDFLTFRISVSTDKKETWLEISGPTGVKDFIAAELEM